MAKWITYTYQCMSCGAIDHERRLEEDPTTIPQVMNCAACGGGRGLEPGDMMYKKKGMRLLTAEEVAKLSTSTPVSTVV